MEQLMALRRKLNQKQNSDNLTPDVQTNDANKNQKPQHPQQVQKQVQSQQKHDKQEKNTDNRALKASYSNEQHKISEQQKQRVPLKSIQSQPILEEGEIDEDCEDQTHKIQKNNQNVDCDSQKTHKKDDEIQQCLNGTEAQKSFTDANQNNEKSRQIIPSLQQVNEPEKNHVNDKERLKKTSTFSQNQNEQIKDCPNQKIVSDQNINGKNIGKQKQGQTQPPKPQLQLSLHNSCSIENNSVHLVHQTKEVTGQQSKPAIKVVLKQLDMIKASIHNLNASYRGIQFLRSEIKKDDLLKRRIRQKLRDLNGSNEFQVLRKLVKMVDTRQNTSLYQKKDNSKEAMTQSFQNPKSLGKLHESNPSHNPQQGELQY